MAPLQEDRGVDPESEEIILTGEGVVHKPLAHVEDATGRPAAIEDDLAGD